MIGLLVLGVSACFSRWKGYIQNSWKEHHIYFLVKLILAFTMIPTTVIVDLTSCSTEESNQQECPIFAFVLVGFWFIVEIVFLYIIYKVYKKTRNEEYKILNITPVMGIMVEQNPLKPIRRAINVEFEGVEIKYLEKNKTNKQENNLSPRLPHLNTWTTIQDEENVFNLEEGTLTVTQPIPDKWRKRQHSKKSLVNKNKFFYFEFFRS